MKTIGIICSFLFLTGCPWITESVVSEKYIPCTDNAVTTGPCKIISPGKAVSTDMGSQITAWTNALATTTVSATIPDGFYVNQTIQFTETDLTAANILSGINIFGVVGTAAPSFSATMGSGAPRDPGSIPIPRHLDIQTTSMQLNINQETVTYAGTNFPTTGGYNYRDVPDQIKDDDGTIGTTCKYALRPSVNCGTTETTIADRIAACAAANPTRSSWNGATECNGSEGLWRLVVRDGANNEVWQDSRTHLIWSSRLDGFSIIWCPASGNSQTNAVSYFNAYNTAVGTPMVGNGTIDSISGGSSSVLETITVNFTTATTYTVSGANCGAGISTGTLTTTAGSTDTFSRAGYCSFTITQGSINFAANDRFILRSMSSGCNPGGSYQSNPPVSYCAEPGGFNPPAGENWGTGTYLAAKGRLGKNSTPSVFWRLPSMRDYKMADLNGIRFVMPDMGISGSQRPTIDASIGGSASDWTATTVSDTRQNAWVFNTITGSFTNNERGDWPGIVARCVGR